MIGLERSVRSLARATEFYCGALGFVVVACEAATPSSSRVRLGLGVGRIDLVKCDAAAMPPPVDAPDPRFQHAAIVAADMSAACARLQPFAPRAISHDGPQRLPAGAGGVTAYKFRDPDGHPLELIHFPPGAGAARWHDAAASAATLGIDHFAIAVEDVDRSIDFYAALGFRVAARQVNRGVAQSRLDGLAESVVEVVALQLDAWPTPHIELLGYRRPAPQPTGAHDATFDRDALLLEANVGGGIERTVSDPDGHVLACR